MVPGSKVVRTSPSKLQTKLRSDDLTAACRNLLRGAWLSEGRERKKKETSRTYTPTHTHTDSEKVEKKKRKKKPR